MEDDSNYEVDGDEDEGEGERAKRVMLPVSKFAFMPDKLSLNLDGGEQEK